MDFIGSRTRENLLRAFAGECQAYIRYKFTASKMKAMNLNIIERAFTFTAEQEREHAEIFFTLINGGPREELRIDSDYPVGNDAEPLAMLQEAQYNEKAEFSMIYPGFADIARQEGFSDVERAFSNIAKIEDTHSKRFKRFADLMSLGQLSQSPEDAEWMCLNCGHVFSGKQVPEKCPVCNHDKGYFIRNDLVPFR